MDIKELIERIAYFRTRRGLSARELSLMIGKHEGYINKLESADFNLPVSVLLTIISALEISEEEFFSVDYAAYAENKELLSLIQALPTDKKKNIIEFIKK